MNAAERISWTPVEVHLSPAAHMLRLQPENQCNENGALRRTERPIQSIKSGRNSRVCFVLLRKFVDIEAKQHHDFLFHSTTAVSAAVAVLGVEKEASVCSMR